ncbi:hypothetical protein N7471_011025 [Penicillium samsonianum]|uniref:uncharacterized protein n=1 Tax=Penicillium samsonianum TaxID=1882272 RepID=UPI002547B044|nr:uncharacterized protein N7471_011025 [Penicillium samsonianum]KAJ6123708.1 hypothetical protein N7471_011025 [Penicillium samsonianum]
MFLNISTMRSCILLLIGVFNIANADSVPFERLNVNDSVLLIVDMQVGLLNLARDFDATLYYNNMITHAAIGELFDIPIIMTTSAQTGPNGPLPKKILEMYPNAPLIERQGEINAWDNPDFRKALKATGKKQVIMAGIVTDVCATFLALSLREEGYSVWENVEASGTMSPLIRDVSNLRMQAAGVQLVGIFSIVADLWRDWRNAPGSETVLQWMNKYAPAYVTSVPAHAAAILNGTLTPGEENFI